MTGIIETTKTVPVYTVGGREFLDRAEAEAYLRKRDAPLRYTYFTVDHAFEHTEGRGYQARTILAVKPDGREPSPVNAAAAATVWCLANLGKLITEWYGRPLVEWSLSGGQRFECIEELDAFLAVHKPRQHFRVEGPVYIDGFGNQTEGPTAKG